MSQQKNEVGFRPASRKKTKPQTGRKKDKSPFEIIAEQIGKLVREKNEAYGSAYIASASILLNLFPNGVHPHRYRDMLLMVRIIDKLMRLATRPDAFGESPYRDISGYGVLGVHSDSQFEGKGPTPPDVGEKV